MKKRYYCHELRVALATLVLFANTSLFGQNVDPIESFQQQLSSMFSNLDTTKITTGFLKDKAVEIVSLSRYDGTALCDSNYVDIATYRSLVKTMNYAAISSSHLAPADSIISRMATLLNENGIPVSVLACQYNYIRTDALTGGFLAYDSITDKVNDVYDQNNNWKNPYDVSNVIGFTPAINISQSSNVHFSFPSELLFSNHNISCVYFDAGNGQGYQSIDIINGDDIYVNYSGAGEYELSLLVTLSGGQQLVAHSVMVISLNSMGPNYAPALNHIVLDTQLPFMITSEALGNYASQTAHIYVKYAHGNETGFFINPLIVAECFDPIRYNKRYDNTPYALCGSQNIDSFYENYRCVIDSLGRNFDLVYIDWDDSCAPLEISADIVKKVIDYVNEYKQDDVQITLMGESMGGLAARYALCDIEADVTIPHHNVKSYISFDTPHLGANVPVGYLYMIQKLFSVIDGTLADFFLSAFAVIGSLFNNEYAFNTFDLLKIRNSPAVKQMLYNYVWPGCVVDNTIHETWQSDLVDMGFPKGYAGKPINLIALSNGSYSPLSTQDALFSITASYEFKYLSMFLCALLGIDSILNLFVTSSNIQISMSVNPYLTNSCEVFNLSYNYKKEFLWLINRTYTDSFTKHAPSSGFPLDKATGSYYNAGVIDIESFINTLSGPNGIFGTPNIEDVHLRDSILFVPTVSSLCVGKGIVPPSGSDYQSSYLVIDTTLLRRTPFNAIYVSDASHHIQKDTAMVSWALDIADFQIVGPTRPTDGYVYQLSPNTPTGGHWYSSDPSVMTITNGQVNILAIGNTTISYLGQYKGKWFELHKDISVGLPFFTIHASGPTNNSIFTITAIPPTNYTGFDPTLVRGMWADMQPNDPEPPRLWIISPISNLESASSVPYLTTKKIGFKYKYNNTQESVPVYVLLTNNGPLDIDLFIGTGGRMILPEDDADNVLYVCSKENRESSSFSIMCADEIATFDHYPNREEVSNAILQFHSVQLQMGTIKPMGDRNYIIIPYKLRDNNTMDEGWASLRIIYSQNTYENQ